MKNKLNKIFCTLLCIVILITGYPITNTVNAATGYTSIKYENGGREFFDQSTYDSYKKNYQLPTIPGGSVIPLKVKGYYLNYRIFTQKNLVVYGSYKSVPDNYFKCGYQIHNDLDIKQPDIYYDGGYFLKPSGVVCRGKEQNPETHGDTCKTNRGEWKYLGFDVSGEKFSNMWMINVATVTSFKERNWIKEPWSDNNKVKKRLTANTSTYNDAAYNTNSKYTIATVQKLKDWMYNTFNSVSKFLGIPNGNNMYDPDVYKYLYVQSAPTIQNAGSGKMWHVRPNGSIWYQTFSIPTLEKKKLDSPVKCYITAASPIPSIPKGSELDSQKVKLQFKVQGVLQDDAYYNDPVTRSAYYTRQDIKIWDLNIDQISGLTLTDTEKKAANVVPKSKADNQGAATITIETTVGEIKGLPKVGDQYQIAVEATAKVNYLDSHTNSAKGSNKFLTGSIPTPPPPEKEPVVIDIPTLDIHNHIGEIAFDSVPFDDVSDSTNMANVKSVELYINGQTVDYDTFFSGQYVFPATTDKNGYFAEVICKYNLDKSKIILDGLTDEEKKQIMSDKVVQYITTDYVYVYPTKPIAQFKIFSNSWKQNRIINVENNSAEGNIQLVLNKYPITEYRWSHGGDTSKLNYGTNTDMQKQLQYKDPGTYSVTLECKNTLGKWSDPYTVEFQVLEDIAPNIEVNLSDSVLTRNDELTAWHYDVNSTDGDRVAAAKIELWYDSDNNGEVDTLVQQWNGLGDNGICEIDDFPKYTPTQLGLYKYKIYAKDEFVGVAGQDTLTQYIVDADKKENSYDVNFWVDNYQPLSDLYVDAPIERPNVDLYIMRDKGLNQDKMTYLSDNRVTLENSLLGRNIIPSINIWDMKTYVYTTPASTSSNTGSSYPADTVPYSSAGYSGTLSRTSVTDNGSYHDFGYTAYRTESKSVSQGASNTTSVTYTYNGSSWSASSWNGSDLPSTRGYSDGEGYSGTLYKGSGSVTGTSGSPPSKPSKGSTYTVTTYWSTTYSGTVSRTVSYWVPDVRWVPNYTGFYIGTIYKYVRQPYTNPWRANSSKYILYISDGNISELADFNTAVSKCDAKIILAGTGNIQTQSTKCDKFIDVTDKSIQEVVNEAMEYIEQETPSIEQIYVLPNQTFTLNTGENDLENDEIVSREMQYIQDKGYFDNPTGQEPGTQSAFNDTGGWETMARSSFANVGKYQIFRRVKDKPTGAYGDDYSYYSGATEVDIYVHRKPIALASLDWDFDSGTNTYITNWLDKSFDLDHNISRAASDKGIIQRKIMWRKDGGEWNYTIPQNLSPGTYNLRYYVKDIENTWSDVFTIDIDGTRYTDIPEVTFTLYPSPPMQFEAKLRSEELQFRSPPAPVTLPASENIEAFDLWTRYPSNPSLSMALFNSGGIQVSTTKTINFTASTGIKTGNDISWNNILYNISKTLTDGNYTFKISANAQQSKTISFPVTLRTPINLKGFINGKDENAQINTGDINVFKFTTSKYVTSTQLVFEGKTYTSDAGQIKLISSDGAVKTWTYTVDIADGAYQDGRTGTAQFMAALPSGQKEFVAVNYKVVGIRASNFLITMMLDIGWRSYYFDLNNGIDDNHDGVSDRYSRRSNTDIGSLKLPVNYYSLIGCDRTYIKAGYKVKGKIEIQGNPDSAFFKANYNVKGETYTDYVYLNKNVGVTYMFEWIIPIETDTKTFICFDLVTTKGSSTYGNEKWVDKWDSRNTKREIFYIKGNAYDDLLFEQSH